MAMNTASSSSGIGNPRQERWYDKWMWYERDATKEEKTLLRKLDLIILTFGCLTFFTKFLDLQAFQNAYVSGMKEDIGMVGNDLQYTTGVFQAGYCVAMIPSNIILTRVRYVSLSLTPSPSLSSLANGFLSLSLSQTKHSDSCL